MKRVFLSILLAVVSLSAVAQQPEAAQGATVSQPEAQGESGIPLVRQVQERLAALGFYRGPVNGEWDERTQHALTQFQLSWPIPAGGQLDDLTLDTLGVVREATQAQGLQEPPPQSPDGSQEKESS